MSETRVREASWTGSETQRREQGICLPPERPASFARPATPRFLVPAGTRCRAKRLTDNAWINHITKQDNGFERFERWTNGHYEFRANGGWLLLVIGRMVRQR